MSSVPDMIGSSDVDYLIGLGKASWQPMQSMRLGKVVIYGSGIASLDHALADLIPSCGHALTDLRNSI